MRKFEAEYRLNEGDDVLLREDAIHRDLDLRIDAVERIAEEFRAGNRLDVDALVRNIEVTFSHLATAMRTLLDDTAKGISADVVNETASRVFLTAARRASILADLRGNVAGEGDTLKKLYDALQKLPPATAVASAIKEAINDLKGGASPAYDTLEEIEASVTAALADKLAKGDFTGTAIRDVLVKSKLGTPSANADTVATRDSLGRAAFTDALNRTSGSAVITRDNRIGGIRWMDSYIEVLIDQTAVAVQASVSDARAKENVATQGDRDEFAKIARLRFVSFDWRADSPFKGHRSLGLIAQEVAEIDREWALVPADETGLYQLDLTALLVSSLRAHQQTAARLHALEARLAALEDVPASR